MTYRSIVSLVNGNPGRRTERGGRAPDCRASDGHDHLADEGEQAQFPRATVAKSWLPGSERPGH